MTAEANRRRRFSDHLGPPRVVSIEENFFDFCAQCHAYRGPSEGLYAELERQYQSACPRATPADLAAARVRIRNILGLKI